VPAQKPIRLLAIASGGGHWVQLLRMRSAWDDCDVTYASVHASSADDVPGKRYVNFVDVSRRSLWRVPIVVAQMLWLVLRVRPQVIVTTGAMPPLLALVLGRLIGARTLWIDSIANSERLSGSGEIARRFAHQVITQWPGLSHGEDPAYWGSVL
jgi:UDP-N-acetylglucosamine:LPS N-acetylglucosamine transferase